MAETGWKKVKEVTKLVITVLSLIGIGFFIVHASERHPNHPGWMDDNDMVDWTLLNNTVEIDYQYHFEEPAGSRQILVIYIDDPGNYTIELSGALTFHDEFTITGNQSEWVFIREWVGEYDDHITLRAWYEGEESNSNYSMMTITRAWWELDN